MSVLLKRIKADRDSTPNSTPFISISFPTFPSEVKEFDDMTISRFSRRVIVSLFVVLPNAGCGPWRGDLDFDATRASEVIINETTREQVEAMFGRPKHTSSVGRSYHYYILRHRMFLGAEVRTLLFVFFFGSDRNMVSGVYDADPDTLEILDQIQKERKAADR